MFDDIFFILYIVILLFEKFTSKNFSYAYAFVVSDGSGIVIKRLFFLLLV